MTDDPNIFEVAAWEREYGPVRGGDRGGRGLTAISARR
jgi:hypothetical protein